MPSTVLDDLHGWIGHQIGSATGVRAFLLLFAGGLLASLLPCVYPLYPITVTILRARKGERAGVAHPLTYYVGLCTVYFGFGIVAALTGGAFNEILRIPGVNIAIGAVLLMLALSIMQLLTFPSLASTNDPRDGFLGTWIMGAGAGLLSSACVGPVVVSILVVFATHAGGISGAMMLVAALKLLAFGMGVGFPIVLLGVVGLKLPRSGAWMLAVQWAFGLLIVYFSFGYFLKGFEGCGLKDDVARTVLLGGAVLAISAFFAQDAVHAVSLRVKRSFFIVAGVGGALTMARNLLPVPTASAAAGGAQAAVDAETKGDLTWYLDKETAYRAAAQSGKPVFVDFHGDWCTNCKAFQDRVSTDAALQGALRKAVLLKVHDGSSLFRSYSADPRFPELRVGLPFFVVTDPEGNVIYKTSDFTRTDEMILILSG